MCVRGEVCVCVSEEGGEGGCGCECVRGRGGEVGVCVCRSGHVCWYTSDIVRGLQINVFIGNYM